MRFLIALSIILFAVPSFANRLDLHYSAALSPVGGDIIVGDKIGRYVLDLTPEYSTKYFRASFSLRAYGVTDWISADQRGHGWDKFTTDYAWKVDEWRYATTTRVEVGKKDLYVFTQLYKPINRHQWGGHGQSTEYYYLVGIGGTLNIFGD